ncbi:cuticle protein 18.6 [Bicyclus anynana]|uniref:Cuticle protein 18.6 n=1 Tax=Bicyclus anynana TaxID=110368 RepID=A0A6J1MV30_BICAN|nr:cuticle protein 18.6 [Bicyclus anynana]
MFKQIIFTALVAVVVAKPGIHSVAYSAPYVAAPAVYSAPLTAAYTAPVAAAYTAPVAAAYTAPVAAAYTAPVAAAYTAPFAAAYSAPVAAAYTSPILPAAYRAPVLLKHASPDRARPCDTYASTETMPTLGSPLTLIYCRDASLLSVFNGQSKHTIKMFKFLIFFALLAFAVAKPLVYTAPIAAAYSAYTAPVAAAYTSPVAYSAYSAYSPVAYSAYTYASPYSYYL